MSNNGYSAGAVKHSFWFMEFKKYISLLAAGNSASDVKVMAIQENIFGTNTIARAKQIYNTVTARINSLDDSIISVFIDSDIATQKLIALVAAMSYDVLFFDLVYEVVREKLIIGVNDLSMADVNVFFKNKSIQDEKVASWTDQTCTRLGRAYLTMLFESGLLDTNKGTRKIQRPILDPVFERWLKEQGMNDYIKALTGER